MPKSLRPYLFATLSLVAFVAGFFLLFPWVDKAAHSLCLIPPVVCGLLFGMRGGVASGFLTAVINTLLGFAACGFSFHPEAIPGFVLLPLVGYAMGRLTDLKRGFERELRSRIALEAHVAQTTSQWLVAGRLAELGEMSANIAHELGTPLAIIGASAEHLEMAAEGSPQLDSAPVRDTAIKIRTTVERIHRIVSGLRVISRDGSSEPMTRISIQKLVDDSLTFSLERAKKLGIDVKLEIPSSETLIECSATQVGQALINLVNNARDALEKSQDKWIRVEVKDAGDRCVFSVSDGGRGIPDEIRDRIFSPFFTTKPSGTGTGLGLSLTRQIAELHGGELSLDLSRGHTSFVLSLPKDRKARSQAG